MSCASAHLPKGLWEVKPKIFAVSVSALTRTNSADIESSLRWADLVPYGRASGRVFFGLPREPWRAVLAKFDSWWYSADVPVGALAISTWAERALSRFLSHPRPSVRFVRTVNRRVCFRPATIYETSARRGGLLEVPPGYFTRNWPLPAWARLVCTAREYDVYRAVVSEGNASAKRFAEAVLSWLLRNPDYPMSAHARLQSATEKQIADMIRRASRAR